LLNAEVAGSGNEGCSLQKICVAQQRYCPIDANMYGDVTPLNYSEEVECKSEDEVTLYTNENTKVE
jgi:hypothetical protein